VTDGERVQRVVDPTDPRVEGVALDNLAAVAVVWARVASTYVLGEH
jgi:hypothetical protein